ncbi:hypothetical protein JW752_03720 [Candidatus Peregrinibacteria bacterium]|nr:hypothetical protein [Candidatus Peregrinibacteria bacterium]
MRTLYLLGAIIVFLMILVLTLPQFGATCVWYLINANSSPPLVLFQAAGLGAIMGGLLVLFWKTPRSGSDEEDSDAETSR